MRCVNCSSVIQDDDTFCMSCGAKLLKCPKCSKTIESLDEFCERCGTKVAPSATSASSNNLKNEPQKIQREEVRKQSVNNPPERYRERDVADIKIAGKFASLRFVIWWMKFFSFVIGIAALGGIGIGIAILSKGGRGSDMGIIIAGGSLLAGAIMVILIMSVYGFIRLFIDIEQNTRKQIVLLEKIAKK